MNKTLRRLWNDQEGQGLVEYALIIALVSVVSMVALFALGGSISDRFDGLDDIINGTTDPS